MNEKPLKHLDLFSGIGGFSLAADRVFGNVEHTFVEHDTFCQAVLKKHWPEAKIHGDIRSFITDTGREYGESWCGESPYGETTERSDTAEETERHRGVDILTGGFPCQPFSHAGRRKGTADDRYLWPEMFECIKLFQPRWVIAENVRGLVTWNDGLVLETVCADLESEGYEVQPLIIPACAVNAPHRRDRVWIIGHNTRNTPKRKEGELADTNPKRPLRSLDTGRKISTRYNSKERREVWTRYWIEVATSLCRVDDGISSRLARLSPETEITAPKWRTNSLKALGNAIVPQVAEQIMRSLIIGYGRETTKA